MVRTPPKYVNHAVIDAWMVCLIAYYSTITHNLQYRLRVFLLTSFMFALSDVPV